MRPLRTLLLGAIVLSLLAPAGCRHGKKDEGEKHGDYVLDGTYYDQTDEEKAKRNAADVLTRLGDKDDVCLIGLWAYNPPQILNAVADAKKLKKVHIVGFDEYEETLNGIEAGTIHATVVQQPFQFGYQSVKLLAKRARDKEAPLPKDVDADGMFYIKHRTIKKDDVAKFRKDLKDLITQGDDAKPAGKITIAFVSNNEHPFWNFARAGARVAAQEEKVNLRFEMPKASKGGAVKAQNDILEDLEGKVDGIAVSINEPESQKEIIDRLAKKIPVVTVDNDSPGSARICYIGTNNVAAGREVGKLVKEVMPKGTIAIFVGMAEPINAKERRKGVLDELAGK